MSNPIPHSRPGPIASASIALATCNGARYLRAALESFCTQSRLPDQLVASDDCSDDDTLALLETFAARAPFDVVILRNDERLGTTANFERALRGCEGDAIFLADQDDVWLETKVAAMTGALDARPAAGAVLCNGLVVDGEQHSLGYDLWQAQGFTAAEQRAVRDERAHEVFLRHVVAAGTTLAFRGCYLPLVLPFPTLRSAHDSWVAFLIAATSDFELLDDALIQYRLHDDNQFGLRLRGWSEQYTQAKVQVEGRAFAYAAEFFTEAAERLRRSATLGFTPRPGVLDAVQAKVAHARRRDELPAAFAARLGPITSEALSGDYGRYSYGWKSILQDLFLR